ncbi:MSMEG_6728 family protein [Arthrobacter sp. Sa2CUA1]|uniref:MSMEG_6728 family protein n=1 Tax=Arthrobacter gallicola TaxID=2762225 RepID=A0ABR8UW28_9MICC|nr:MSMEG_6728 family protein [Arthrobacter gallicola]MBD7996754.1 MSMEG_6728 family protein [Arthrobacter gallicola]
MQTFLPYEDFARSARVLDSPRLGKQRVETLQILRALVVPDYGWQSHPATRMWMGFVPALTAYGLAMTNEWVARGFADTVREQLLEFAPEAASGVVPRPPWLGSEAFHEGHRSNLLVKDPEFYAELFPGTPAGLPYVWPEPKVPTAPADPADPWLWIARPVRDPDGPVIELPMLSARGTPITGKKGRQLERFLDVMNDGDAVALLGPDRSRLELGEVGPVTLTNDTARRNVRLTGAALERSAFAYPALLQDPRVLFTVPVPEVGEN